MVREQGSGTRAAMERLFAQNEVPLKVVMEMPSNETIKQAVMAGMGLSFLSLRTVRHELAGGHIALPDVSGMPMMGNWFVTHLRQQKAVAGGPGVQGVPDRAGRPADRCLGLMRDAASWRSRDGHGSKWHHRSVFSYLQSINIE